MRFLKVTVWVIFSTILACSGVSNYTTPLIKESLIDSTGKQIYTRFLCPKGFKRDSNLPNSYAYFLQNFQLYSPERKVRYFNGDLKSNEVYEAVLKIDVGKRDLQQCADAVMRLRAEYLFQQKRYSQISFRFLGDGKMHSYKAYAGRDTGYAKFRKYMDYVFSYANTASLKKQLKKSSTSSPSIGDVFIQSGNPYGHAICIMDLCRDSSGKIRVLLAQSYMPAQEIHILKNNNNSDLSPWYDINKKTIYTPEWTFDSSDLRRF